MSVYSRGLPPANKRQGWALSAPVPKTSPSRMKRRICEPCQLACSLAPLGQPGTARRRTPDRSEAAFAGETPCFEGVARRGSSCGKYPTAPSCRVRCSAWLGVMVNGRIRQSNIVASRRLVLMCRCHRVDISVFHLSIVVRCSSTSLGSPLGYLPKSVYRVKSRCAGLPTSF
jgi:hypothetical protein